ncbi:hypothetical protein [Bacillus pumilus]|uniref:hypothetical protein n=1 Tax=Bacillus pumilus TaxID=1408 RepID=UPI0011A22155|nr:hypothetical protein [Bacillus pumilus]
MEEYVEGDEVGRYEGRKGNLRGEGFGEEKLKVNGMKQCEYDKWVRKRKKEGGKLRKKRYE